MLRAEISQLRRNNTVSHSGQVASKEEGNKNVLSYTKGPINPHSLILWETRRLARSMLKGSRRVNNTMVY